MALIQRTELSDLLADKEQIVKNNIILLFGERYLCRESAEQLKDVLTAAGKEGAVHPIDGESENPEQTIAKLLSFSLLPGKQLYLVTDSTIFHSKSVAADIWEKARVAAESSKEHAAMRHLGALARLGSLKLESQQPFSEISAAQWINLFGFDKPGTALDWADKLLVQAVGTGKLPAGSRANAADKLMEAFSGRVPPQNYLILSTENIDKRQKLFKFIQENGLVVDCSIATGSAAAAQKAQREVLLEMVNKTLREGNKSMDQEAINMLFDRIGPYPVAIVSETEKLMHYVGDAAHISTADVANTVGRSREDALFELTEAFGKRQVGNSLVILNRLQDNGTHGLAILATMRNYLKRLLIQRSIQLQPSPRYERSMSAKEFQNAYLPALKKSERFKEHLSGHPYALYMGFQKASEFGCTYLRESFTHILEAEYRLKGSPVDQRIILEDMFLTLFRANRQM